MLYIVPYFDYYMCLTEFECTEGHLQTNSFSVSKYVNVCVRTVTGFISEYDRGHSVLIKQI